MGRKEPDFEPDIAAVPDRGESPLSMEPLLIGESSRHRAALTDLALELAQKSTGFRRSLPSGLLPPLANLVRAMNCYYSNLIEGYDTDLIDIERASCSGPRSKSGSIGCHQIWRDPGGRALSRRTPARRCPAIVGTGERQARRVVSALLDRHVLTAESTRAPLRLAFPASLVSRWMPGLFPEQPHASL